MIGFIFAVTLIVFGVIVLMAIGIHKATKDDHRNDRMATLHIAALPVRRSFCKISFRHARTFWTEMLRAEAHGGQRSKVRVKGQR